MTTMVDLTCEDGCGYIYPHAGAKLIHYHTCQPEEQPACPDCGWVGRINANGLCGNCTDMAVAADRQAQRAPWLDTAYAADDGEAGVACPVCEGDIAYCGWECGYASELDMLDDIYARIEARAEAQGAL